jgi:hypothetical protein
MPHRKWPTSLITWSIHSYGSGLSQIREIEGVRRGRIDSIHETHL